MKNIISILDDEIRLCSGLGEYSFGKTNYNTIVTKQGLLATCNSCKDGNYDFSFEPWSFSDIKSFDTEDSEERLVFYCGSNPLSKKACTLTRIFENAGSEQAQKKDKDIMYKVSLAVCAALTQAAKDGTEIPLNGSGGIIADNFDKASDDITGIKLLFIPQDLFKYSTAGLSAEEQSDILNCWINPSLTGLPAICFLRASVAYKMLTGRFAYPASDTLTRNADILDKNFLPLELSINGIDPELAQNINKGLKLNSNSVSIPGKKPKGKRSEELIPQAEFPLDLLANAKEAINSKLSDQEFQDKVNSYKKMQNSRVNTKRTLRRNTAAFITGFIAIVAVALFIRSAYKNYLSDYTSKGLTSVQTIQAFFKGMNNLDVTLMENVSRGRGANSYSNAISSVYVISKQRVANGGDQGYLKPAKFFVIVDDYSKFKQGGLYGITNLKIDGKAYDEYIELKKNGDKPEPVTTEQGITLADGDKSVHAVEYYTIHTEDTKVNFVLSKNTDTFTLTYKKGKWLITDIEIHSEDIPLDSEQFKSDYFKRVSENNGDVIKAIRELSLTYDFLPSQKELETEKRIWIEYISDPFKDILKY